MRAHSGRDGRPYSAQLGSPRSPTCHEQRTPLRARPRARSDHERARRVPRRSSQDLANASSNVLRFARFIDVHLDYPSPRRRRPVWGRLGSWRAPRPNYPTRQRCEAVCSMRLSRTGSDPRSSSRRGHRRGRRPSHFRRTANCHSRLGRYPPGRGGRKLEAMHCRRGAGAYHTICVMRRPGRLRNS
jgi:hypothetical protein